MFRKKKKKKIWKYLNLDIEDMSEEEFLARKPELEKAVITRGFSGGILLIVCLIVLICGGKFLG